MKREGSPRLEERADRGPSFITEMDEGGGNVTKVIFIPSGWPRLVSVLPQAAGQPGNPSRSAGNATSTALSGL